MGGLVREKAEPGRQNQVLITDAPKNKHGIISDVPTLDSITKLWEAVDDEKFNANHFSTNKVQTVVKHDLEVIKAFEFNELCPPYESFIYSIGLCPNLERYIFYKQYS